MSKRKKKGGGKGDSGWGCFHAALSGCRLEAEGLLHSLHVGLTQSKQRILHINGLHPEGESELCGKERKVEIERSKA